MRIILDFAMRMAFTLAIAALLHFPVTPEAMLLWAFLAAAFTYHSQRNKAKRKRGLRY